MAFFSKPSEDDPLLAHDAESGERAPEAPSKKRPALKKVLGGIVLCVTFLLGAAAVVDQPVAVVSTIIGLSKASYSYEVEGEGIALTKQQKYAYSKCDTGMFALGFVDAMLMGVHCDREGKKIIPDASGDFDHYALYPDYKNSIYPADGDWKDRVVLNLRNNQKKNGATIGLEKGADRRRQAWIYDASDQKIKLKANPKYVVQVRNDVYMTRAAARPGERLPKTVGKIDDLENGATIELWEDIKGSEYQQWIYEWDKKQTSAGKFHLKANPKYVLNGYESDGAKKINLWRDGDGDKQLWVIQMWLDFRSSMKKIQHCMDTTKQSALDCSKAVS